MNRNHVLPSYKLHTLLAPNRALPRAAHTVAAVARDRVPAADPRPAPGWTGWSSARPRLEPARAQF